MVLPLRPGQRRHCQVDGVGGDRTVLALMWLRGGQGQAVVGRPRTSFQVANRMPISCR
jgi:hypothetical protein